MPNKLNVTVCHFCYFTNIEHCIHNKMIYASIYLNSCVKLVAYL